MTTDRLRARDTLAVFAGGIGAALAGVWWLVATGAWPHVVEVWTTWNADYLVTVFSGLPYRITIQLGYFPPHSACALLAVPLACRNLRDRSGGPAVGRRRALAGVYLAWLLTVLLLQRPFHYVHVPKTLLMLAVFAANRWPVPPVLVALQVAAGGLFALTGWGSVYAPPHPSFEWERTRWWGRCVDRSQRPAPRYGETRRVE